MQFTETAIPEVVLIEPRVFGDERRFFMETWNARSFAEAGLNLQFVQDNHSRSASGTQLDLYCEIDQPHREPQTFKMKRSGVPIERLDVNYDRREGN